MAISNRVHVTFWGDTDRVSRSNRLRFLFFARHRRQMSPHSPPHVAQDEVKEKKKLTREYKKETAKMVKLLRRAVVIKQRVGNIMMPASVKPGLGRFKVEMKVSQDSWELKPQRLAIENGNADEDEDEDDVIRNTSRRLF